MTRASTLVCLVLTFHASSRALAQHPLDPLTAAEIQAAAKVLSAAPQFPAGAQFVDDGREGAAEERRAGLQGRARRSRVRRSR